MKYPVRIYVILIIIALLLAIVIVESARIDGKCASLGMEYGGLYVPDLAGYCLNDGAEYDVD